MKKILFFLFFLSFYKTPFLLSVEQITQPGSPGGNFDQKILCKAYDRFSGTFYVGTKGALNYNYAISKAGRTDTEFTGIATDAKVSGAGTDIEALALAYTTGLNSPATHLVARVPRRIDSAHLKILNLTDKLVQDSADLKKTTGANAKRLGAVAYGYINNAAQIFVRVSESSSGGNEGQKGNGDGIAILNVNANISPNTAELSVNSPTVFQRVGAVGGTEEHDVPLTVNDMYWDNNLQILYIVVRANIQDPATGTTTDYNVGYSVLKGTVASNGNISLSKIIDSSFYPDNTSDDTFDTYIATIIKDGETATFSENYKVRTMRTSTGLNYLILDTPFTPNNKFTIIALRLASQDNIPAKITKGDIVKAAGSALGIKFTNDSLGSDNQLIVGGDGVPMKSIHPSDIEVIGDTVYVSLSAKDRGFENANDPGIWASTAMFDETGAISSWTKWERVFPSQNNSVSGEDLANLFAIDGQTGLLWQARLDNTIASAGVAKVVERTKIQTTSFDASSLPQRLNSDFFDGCSCVLDLPQQTPGLGLGVDGTIGMNTTTTDNSLCIFGGIEKVAFVRTVSNQKATGGTRNAVSTKFDTINGKTNYILTTLSGAGVVRSLGYSRKFLDGTTTQGYFLAGTDTGLWIYAATTGELGFDTKANTDSITDLTKKPFDGSFTWQHAFVDKITGPITAIEANGKYIFVVEQDVTTIGEIKSKLWRLELKDKFTDFVVTKIAESGVGNLPTNSIFTGFKIVTPAGSRTANQHGLLSTNEGIYRSQKTLATTTLATDLWDLIGTNDPFHSIYAPKRTSGTLDATHDGISLKLLGISVTDGSEAKKYYQNAALQEFGFKSDASTKDIKQIVYTSAATTDGGLGTDKVLDRTTTIWTDGARRLYTRFNPKESVWNSLQSLPFRTTEWNMSGPYSADALASVPRIYWIENISGLGIILMGTDTGVVAIE